jgi:tRNA U-34 5-methylaminomethyl-2-thiouridine biosynthesis protein MnmC
LKKVYDYVVVGGGIAGCSTAYFLSKYSKNILLIEKDKIASGGSGAAGAFLSPLLGKDNIFKSIVRDALTFSSDFYTKNFPNFIDSCGVLRVPKDDKDRDKFLSYQDSMDFDYEIKSIENDTGYFFDIGSVINSQGICNALVKNIDKKLNTEIKSIKYIDNIWSCNDNYFAKNIILCTGVDDILNEDYINIRPVWGQRCDIKSDYKLDFSIHKNHSISKNQNGIISIGATHHIGIKNQELSKSDTQKLIEQTKDILNLENNIEVVDTYSGCRACSVDYLPIVGEVVNSKKTLQEFPYLVHGTHVPQKRLCYYPNLYILNGVGGRGFVLSPYVANLLVEFIINSQDYVDNIKPYRLFKKYVRKNDKR